MVLCHPPPFGKKCCHKFIWLIVRSNPHLSICQISMSRAGFWLIIVQVPCHCLHVPFICISRKNNAFSFYFSKIMTKTDITFSEIRTFSADSEEESQSRTIRMNISGTLFQVQLSTLRRFPDSRLAKLSEDDTVLTKTVYFDQDATLFGHILRCAT